MSNIKIRISPIEGQGVFALRDFLNGEIVIDWSKCSRVLSQQEFLNLSEEEKNYVSFIDKKYVLFLEPARFVNHSCQANTKALNNGDVAVRNIKKGEEITADYTAENAPGLKFKCNCQSNNCKGWIRLK